MSGAKNNLPGQVESFFPEQQTSSLQEALDLAMQHHTAGRFPDAETLYQQILQTEPNHPDALHLLGVIALQLGKNDVAVDLITKALATRDDYPEAHSNLGNAFRELGQLDEAVTSYHRALSIKPNYTEVLSNLSVALQELGKLEASVESCHKALAIKPDYAEAHYNLGNAQKELGQLDDAVASYYKTLAIKPDYAEAHYNLGTTFEGQGTLEEAIISYHKALFIKPDYAEAHNNLGNLLQELGRLEEAVASYQKVIDIKPDYAEAYSNLGNVLRDLGRLDEAIASFQMALDVNPDYADAFNNIWLSLPPICHDIITNHRNVSPIEKIIDSLPTPPEPDILRLQLKSLTGGNTQEAWHSVIRNLPTTQSETIFNDNKTRSPSTVISKKQSQRKMVALLHFGRSGSGYLHSLLDGHPNVSTLPGIYMSGFFGRKVWARISSNGFRGCPEQFASLYKVLFDARNPDKIPPAFISDTQPYKSVGVKEGFVNMGPNRDTPLTLDHGQFLENLREVLDSLEALNHGQYFEAIHHAYEKTLGGNFNDKRLIFYHLHSNEPYCMANFLKYFPNTQLLMITRNPLQSCESWVLKLVNDKQKNAYKTYHQIVYRIITMLMDLNCPAFQTQDGSAVRLEDFKIHPKKTMRRLCIYLGIEETPSLYASTMQGLKWWGDPSSSLFGRTQTLYDAKDDPTTIKTGGFFSTADQNVLDTLFYPLSARIGYVEENDPKFRKDLKEIRPLLDKPLDFEKTLAKEFSANYPNLEKTEAFKSLHVVLIELWRLLNENGTYPYMVKALPEI